jgi:hypothetical protein
MNILRSGFAAGIAAAAVLAAGAVEVSAQNTRMPSTLRYGSGYFDAPVASVLPHLAITGTWSGFWIDANRLPLTGPRGEITGFGAGRDRELLGDASVAIGLFDRAEVGVSLQEMESFGGTANQYGFFGRLAILRPEQQGLGLAVGARYLTASGDNVQPGRLGFNDPKVRDEYAPGAPEAFSSELTPYVVGSAMLRGFTAPLVPKHDWTLSVGWGDGLFRDGRIFDWYADSYSDGWFLGAASHIELGHPNRLLHLLGDYNGFDVNLGTQLDLGGVRIGAHVLGVNYRQQFSDYRSRKFGVIGSVALCPADGFFCKPALIEREQPIIERIVSAPDTVIVEREVAPPLPTGTPASICLATGENAQVMVTAQGDTLVGPQRVSIRTLRPGVVFAGTYAEGRDWFTSDQAIPFERANYSKSGGEVRLDCANIARIGEHMGVPLFAESTANRPFQRIFVPVRPGVWQAYETGLQRTRGN